MTPDLLSAIVLLEPGQSPHELDPALLAIAVQEWESLEAIIVCNEIQIADVRNTCDSQPWSPLMRFKIISLPIEVKDNNSNRLNTALKNATGQYITILQTNDIVYGFAFKRLIEVLKKSAEPIAIGGTRNAWDDQSGYVFTKTNHNRVGKKRFDVWFDEECARNFVIDRNKVKSALATEASLDFQETYFLLLALSLHNEFNFSCAAESLFERRCCNGQKGASDEINERKLRARSKIIDWKSTHLNNFFQQGQT